MLRPFLLSLIACVALPATADDALLPQDAYYDWNDGAYGDNPNQTFVSTNLKAPRFLINNWQRESVSEGSHIFMTPIVADQDPGPFIFDANDMSLVYSDPSWPGTTDTKVQMFEGKPYMTFWAGYDMKGHGSGYGMMVDQQYRNAYNITTQNLTTGADSHEFQLTHDGGALVNNYHIIITDLTSMGGPVDGKLLDCAFQEIDIKTGKLRFSWKATDHFDLTETEGDEYFDDEQGWDWFHMNSLQKTLDGNYLISSRHLRALALINGTDGSRLWQVGGHRNSFRDLTYPLATNFGYQHHARFVDDTQTEITFFDNQVMHTNSPTPGCSTNCSRGVRIKLNHQKGTVELVSEIYHSRSVQAWAEGGYHLLPNGNALIAWGVVGAFSEYTPDGVAVFDAQAGPWYNTPDGNSQLYRVYKFDWKGYPTWDPSIGVKDSMVYVSWNGATEVASWNLYGGNATNTVEYMTNVPRAGFETPIRPPVLAYFVRVEAVDASGKVLGSTKLIDSASGDVQERPLYWT